MIRFFSYSSSERSFITTIWRNYFTFLFFCTSLIHGQQLNVFPKARVSELDNAIFKSDPYWRGADGASSIQLDNDRVLWLFSDTFIDQDGTYSRKNAKHMVRNSIGIQHGKDPERKIDFYFGGTAEAPEDFFKTNSDNWYWTGHGLMLNGQLLVFLFEEKETNEGLGFEAVGWAVALIRNPNTEADKWEIEYFNGPDYDNVIVGSAAVLQDQNYVYAYGVEEPDSHVTFLLRTEKETLLNNPSSAWEWYSGHHWTKHKNLRFPLFNGATEFSVHFDEHLRKYMQIQSFGFGHASLGYRLSENIEGPWSDPVIFFKPEDYNRGELIYSAKAHPEISQKGNLIITYNVNNSDFETLLRDETVYYPRLISLRFTD